MRYEPAEKPPLRQAMGAALLIFVPNTISVILLTTFVVRASGESDNYLAWVTFTGLAISGISMILHAFPFRHLGSGGLVVTNLNVPLLAMSVLALAQGGPGLLATLVIASTLLQFVLVSRLSSLRRVFTPTVSGIIIMLVAVSAVPFIVDRTIAQSQDQSAVVVIPGIVALGAGLWGAVQASAARRVWTLPIAVAAGLAVAIPMGLYDGGRLDEASWLSFGDLEWPQWQFDFGVQFWSMLPAFLIVKLTAFLKVVGDLSVIKRASYREPPWSSTAVYIGFTGISARSVGIYLGLLTLLIAPFGKVIAALAATPNSVVSAVYIMVFGLLFIEGAKWVFAGPLNNRKSVITGVSLVLGLSAGSIGQLSEGIWSELVGNTVILGAVTAIVMTAVTEFRGLWPRKLHVDLSHAALADIGAFLERFATKNKWSESAQTRLNLAVEEAVLTLLEQGGDGEANLGRRLVASVHADGDAAEVELVVYSREDIRGNIEDQLALVSDHATVDDAQQLSTRLLRHFASSVHHRKYHGVDVITCRVEQ